MKCRQRTSFTIVEVLMSLAILAMLMSAVGAAVHACLHSYNENTEIAALTQAARSILYRMTRDVRRAAAVEPTSSLLTIFPPDDGSGVTQIQYELVNGALIYRRTVDGSDTDYPLLGSDDEVTVQAFEVDWETGKDWQGLDCTRNVTLHLTLLVDGQTFSSTASAAPRRNQLY